MAKTQANAKQHPEAELSIFENCYHLKIRKRYNKQKNQCIYIHTIYIYTNNLNGNEDENEK